MQRNTSNTVYSICLSVIYVYFVGSYVSESILDDYNPLNNSYLYGSLANGSFVGSGSSCYGLINCATTICQIFDQYKSDHVIVDPIHQNIDCNPYSDWFNHITKDPILSMLLIVMSISVICMMVRICFIFATLGPSSFLVMLLERSFLLWALVFVGFEPVQNQYLTTNTLVKSLLFVTTCLIDVVIQWPHNCKQIHIE